MKKNLINSIIKQRKFLENKKKLELINKKSNFFLFCHFNNLNGLGLKLLKYFLLNLNLNLNLNFNYNILKTNSKQHNIILPFNNNLFELLNELKNKSIIPFILYPLYIINLNENILFSFKFIKDLNFLKFNKKILINNIFIKFLKKNIINILYSLNIKKKN